MRRGFFFFLLVFWGGMGEAGPSRLEHRLWLLGDYVPQVAALQKAGIDAVVVPVGVASLSLGQASFKVTTQASLAGFKDLPVWALLWVEGAEANGKSADSLWNQLGPVVRGLPVPAKGIVLAARKWVTGLSYVAQALQRQAGLSVELAAPASELVAASSREKFGTLALVAFALGNLQAEGLPALAPYDAEGLLDALDSTGAPLRAAVVLTSLVKPALPPGENPWSFLLHSSVDYQPGQDRDVFIVRGSVATPTSSPPSGSQIELLAMDGARLQRDLGIVLRPVRSHLIGWDSVGVPLPTPSLGLSWEAFASFFSGAPPEPRPVIQIQWLTKTKAKITVENSAPFASSFGLKGNAVDISFTGSEVQDVNLLAATGADFGRLEGDFQRTARGAATTLRLYLKVFPPGMAMDVAEVQFVSQPSRLSARFVARLGDGRELRGEAPILAK